MKTSTNLKLLLPEGKDPVNIGDITGDFEAIDTYLANMQTASGDASKNSVVFAQAADRQNIASTETLSTIMGKIAKFFTDIKAAAFCAIANNDTTTAEGYAADARIVKTHGDEIDALSAKASTNEKNISSLNSNLTNISSKVSSFQTGVDALYNQIVSLGVTPSGKTLDAVKNSISSVSNNSYNSGYGKGYDVGYATGLSNTDQVVSGLQKKSIGLSQYGAQSGSVSFSSSGHVCIMGAIINKRQVYGGRTATLSVNVNGTGVGSASSTSNEGTEDGVALGNFCTSWISYVANSGINASVSGDIERMAACVHVAFIPA